MIGSSKFKNALLSNLRTWRSVITSYIDEQLARLSTNIAVLQKSALSHSGNRQARSTDYTTNDGELVKQLQLKLEVTKDKNSVLKATVSATIAAKTREMEMYTKMLDEARQNQ